MIDKLLEKFLKEYIKEMNKLPSLDVKKYETDIKEFINNIMINYKNNLWKDNKK